MGYLNFTTFTVILELWLLLFWEDENSVSPHSIQEVKTEPPPAVGNDCEAIFRGKEYTGKIAATG